MPSRRGNSDAECSAGTQPSRVGRSRVPAPGVALPPRPSHHVALAMHAEVRDSTAPPPSALVPLPFRGGHEPIPLGCGHARRAPARFASVRALHSSSAPLPPVAPAPLTSACTRASLSRLARALLCRRSGSGDERRSRRSRPTEGDQDHGDPAMGAKSARSTTDGDCKALAPRRVFLPPIHFRRGGLGAPNSQAR